MKLHSLEMQAFGPFAKTELIEFDQLGTNPLFLIDGPTGAGKSSILHAICYALYGETTDSDRKELGLRCDHADKDLLTQLTVEFSIRDQRYRIQRVPTQMRPAKKGEGETEQKATAHLSQLSADGNHKTLVPKKVKEAKDQIHRIIGLTAEQFRQVMVLPQGKFRELLLASSDNRQKILSTLFQTEIYKKIEETLKEKSADIERKNTAFENSKRDALSDVELEDREALLLEINLAEHACKRQLEQKESAQKEYQLVMTQFKEAEQLTNAFLTLSTKSEQLQACLEQTDYINDKKQAIKYAEKALSIAPIWQSLTTVIAEIEKKQTDIEGVKAQQTELEKTVDIAKADFQLAEKNYQQRDALKAQQTNLLSYQTILASYAQLEKTVFDTEASYNDTIKSRAGYQQQVESIVSEISKATLSSEKWQKSIAKKADLIQKRSKTEQTLQRRTKLDNANSDLEKYVLNQDLKRQVLERTRADYAHKKAVADHIEMQWHRHQAAILAAELKINEPCVVCGSLEHPKPAILPDDAPKQDEVEAARIAQDACVDLGTKANTESTEADNLVNQKQIEINELEAELATDIQYSAESLKHTLNEVELELNKISEDEIALESNKQHLVSLQTKLSELNKKLADTEAILPELSAQHAKAQVELKNAQSGLPEQYRDQKCLNRAIEQLNTQLVSLEQSYQLATKVQSDTLQQQASIKATLTTLHNNLELLNASKLKHETAWTKALLDSEFSDQNSFDNANLDTETLQAYKSEVKQYDEQLHTLKVEKDLLTQQLASKQKPDLIALEHSVKQTHAEYKAQEINWTSAEKYHAKLKDIETKLHKIDKQQADIKQQYEVIGTLSNAAAGKGNIKVSLERFVLGNLLDSVLSLASQRLHIMSKGQYRLIRQNESEQKRNQTAGLDLAIDDAYTGKTRPVATLSGGESFMASLSLALGLSDVVQERSGGIQLDTLFIDEGFGSLDQESLQLAIQTLIDLQSTGRTIGIISHVSELKEQMSQRIEVVGTREGSRVRVIS